MKRRFDRREATTDRATQKQASTEKVARRFFKNLDDKRLIVVLEQASLEVIKTSRGHELLNCDKHRHLMGKLGKDPTKCRPDITHQSLLMLMDSPLNKAGMLQVYVHTERHQLIQIHPQTRIPRTFDRFCGLMVQLILKLGVQAENNPVKLLKVIKNPVTAYFPPGCVKIGTSCHTEELVEPRSLAPTDGSPVVIVVGALAHGSVDVDYTERTVAISSYPLSAALVCAKICSGFEEVWGIH